MPPNVITSRRLNRATLARQLLLHRETLAAADGVHRVVALQAQQAASPYVALFNRLAGFDPAGLDAAFAAREVTKATLMRITLHAVHAADYPAFHAAMQPTLRGGLGDKRFTGAGLTVAEADALVPHLVEFAARPRTVAECEAFLAERVSDLPKGVWWALRRFAPLTHAPTGAPWAFGYRPSYVAAPTQSAPDEPVQHLVRRYLEGFGPATVKDVAQFALLQQGRVREAVQAMDLEDLEGPEQTVLFDVPGAPRPAEDTPAPPRLMAMWDSILLAYADRSRVIPPEYRPLVTRRNGDVLPTLLVDGYVAGVWRPVADGIEATAFHALSDDAWRGLAEEARALVAFLAEREPAVYSRYAHWWAKLPDGDVRILPG